MGFAAGTFRGIALASAALLGGIAGGAPAVATGVQATGQWPVYANARYGYRVCYPAALLKPAAEAPNGDGRRFNGPGGAVLRVWGSNNVLNDTAATSASEDRKRLTRGGQVTYAVVKPNWYVLSGKQGGQIFYLKSVLANGAFSTMELRYPASAQRQWAPVTARLSKCFSAA